MTEKKAEAHRGESSDFDLAPREFRRAAEIRLPQARNRVGTLLPAGAPGFG
jgi:hypothetical protein